MIHVGDNFLFSLSDCFLDLGEKFLVIVEGDLHWSESVEISGLRTSFPEYSARAENLFSSLLFLPEKNSQVKKYPAISDGVKAAISKLGKFAKKAGVGGRSLGNVRVVLGRGVCS